MAAPDWDEILAREIQIRAIAHSAPDIREATWERLRAALRSITDEEVGKVAWDQDFLRQGDPGCGFDAFPGIADGVRQSTTRVELLIELHRRLTDGQMCCAGATLDAPSEKIFIAKIDSG